jgi:large subunit ribosomal protein L30
MSKKNITITLIKSPIGSSAKQRKILESLGIKKINKTISHKNTPEILGMIKKVKHLISIEEN